MDNAPAILGALVNFCAVPAVCRFIRAFVIEGKHRDVTQDLHSDIRHLAMCWMKTLVRFCVVAGKGIPAVKWFIVEWIDVDDSRRGNFQKSPHVTVVGAIQKQPAPLP